MIKGTMNENEKYLSLPMVHMQHTHKENPPSLFFLPYCILHLPECVVCCVYRFLEKRPWVEASSLSSEDYRLDSVGGGRTAHIMICTFQTPHQGIVMVI